jgi:murein DD-endopeptidase MepM/ murein hydrolase activator NlpD
MSQRSNRVAIIVSLVVAALASGAILGALTTGPAGSPGPTGRPLALGSPSPGPGQTAPAPGAASGSPASTPPSSSDGPAASGSEGPPSGPPATAGSVVPGAAPTSAAGFVKGKAVVPMGWPFGPSVKVKFGPGFGAFRVGPVEPFNMISGVSKSGALLRGHDGLDLQVPVGTPVLAPFSGQVIDPATRWVPWDPARYGKVVAIVSDEPTSTGYTVILVHLSLVGVPVGSHVSRGQAVGLTGITGDAAGTIPHLHLELRAPFLLRYLVHGVIRRIDAFDPRPSLLAAQPKRP